MQDFIDLANCAYGDFFVDDQTGIQGPQQNHQLALLKLKFALNHAK